MTAVSLGCNVWHLIVSMLTPALRAIADLLEAPVDLAVVRVGNLRPGDAHGKHEQRCGGQHDQRTSVPKVPGPSLSAGSACPLLRFAGGDRADPAPEAPTERASTTAPA